MTQIHLLQRLRPGSLRARRALTALGILAAATLTSVSIFATGPSPTPQVRTEKAWPVSVVTAEPQPLRPSFTAFGRVESSRIAGVGTDLAAPVAKVHVREGDWVAEGDLLVELADAEASLTVVEREADLAQYRAELASIASERAALARSLEQARSMNRIAQEKLERHRTLLTRRLISQSLLDEMVAEANRAAIELESHERRLADLPHRIAAQEALVTKAGALVERARLDLAKTRVMAPFAGPVLAVHVAPGDRSRVGNDLVELADASAMEVRLQIPAAYERRFQRALDTAETIAAELPEGTVLALARLARQVRPGQSGRDAFFQPAAGAATELPAIGSVVDVRIRLPEEQGVVALPIAALYGNDRVYAVRDRRLRAIAVERVGELHTPGGEYRVLVRSPDLASGMPVITTQLPKATSGLLVEAS